MNYKLVKGPDNITWVSIEPLRDDVLTSLYQLEQVNTEELSNIDKDIMNFNILGMKAIGTFLNSLIQESNNETIDRPTTH